MGSISNSRRPTRFLLSVEYLVRYKKIVSRGPTNGWRSVTNFDEPCKTSAGFLGHFPLKYCLGLFAFGIILLVTIEGSEVANLTELWRVLATAPKQKLPRAKRTCFKATSPTPPTVDGPSGVSICSRSARKASFAGRIASMFPNRVLASYKGRIASSFFLANLRNGSAYESLSVLRRET